MYNIFLQPPAEKFLKRLDKKSKKQVTKKLEQLKQNPELGKPLVGRLVGLWSLRIGIYRAIYQIKHSELLVLVLKIGHREEIYQ